ncbi:MBOAT family protein [Sulfurovum sp. zt1-1]|uniref:MBOAT family protein n=1 Tax=Sulfurovum zhangzhouensis TaxID=3019067 RepID=A0ABT7R0B4_9BACT|nr:MBOAT family O-acyltransferase [Sulfurovum zhangzhouensis]MDM5272538.1 MBOAT family protein [Sulfurovum zhangzhouensis]
MLFNSYEFIFAFLPFTFFVYFYLNKKRLTEAAKGFVVAASLFFYSWWNIVYLPLILGSILFNYIIGKSLSKKNELHRVSKKSLLTVGIIANVSLLGYYKYSDFFISNINRVADSEISLLHLTLPLAISFFTFQQIAYLVDSYRGQCHEYDFINYAAFVTFFPQLIAGPIVHHKEMMPQFARSRNKVINYENIAKGLFIFSIGLFKKVIIADTFATWATAGFDKVASLNFFEAWATSYFYTFQLYFDFSGYTDMAIGAALLFNIKLPLNFNSPYKATSLIDFWHRWHMTLTRFVNAYIFNPIVRSYKTYTYSKGMLAIFISMVIIGFWHGASWMFVFFGSLHGVGLVINHIWKKLVKIQLPKLVGWFLTFNFFNISVIFFRAKEWDDAMKVLGGMLGLHGIVFPYMLASPLSFLSDYGVEFGNWVPSINGNKWILVWLAGCFIIILAFKNSNEKLDTFVLNYKTAIFTGICFISSLLYFDTISDFLYFNF